MINANKFCYSTEFTEIPLYPQSTDQRCWRDGMVGGNGIEGFVTSGSPYNDKIIYQNINFIMPNTQPRYTPEEVTSELEQARQAVINYDDSWDVNGRVSTYFYCFHPSHQLSLSMKNRIFSDYIRYTDYETGEVVVSYRDIDGTWERRTFTSRTDAVTITKIGSSSNGKKINMTLSIDDISAISKFGGGDEINLRYKKIVPWDCSYIAQVAHYPSYDGSELKNAGYAGVTYIVTKGGTKERVVLTDTQEAINVGWDKNPAIKITDADEVYLITKSDRTFEMGGTDNIRYTDSFPFVEQMIEHCKQVAEAFGADDFSYENALAPSAAIQKAMYNAVDLNLGTQENKALSNEDLLSLQRKSKKLEDAAVERAYNQGRYAMICCAGTTMSRLCGMWTGEFNPGWRGIYTMDANVNIQTSGMSSANVKEFGIGYINFVLRQIDDWKDNAAKCYGMTDAIQVPVNTDGDRAMMVEYSRWYPFQYWNAGASWMLQPIYEFYQCFGNIIIDTDEGEKELLNDILLPLLTLQANFWEQLVTPEYYTDVNGKACYEKGKTSLNSGEKYLIIPSYSPENTPKGYNSTITANATMDISAARDGLKMTIEVEKLTQTDGYEERVARIEELIFLLPDYMYDESGAIREWAMNEYIENNEHRHISHLYCAWPALETQGNAALTAACNQAIENRNRENAGKDDTASHGWVHKALVFARLKNSEACYDTLYTLMSSDIYYNSMMTDHNTDRSFNVYCTDTSLGMIGIIDEMLLYSNNGEIEALPALPEQWTKGSIKGLRAKTNAEVSIEWDENTVVVTVTSDAAQNIAVSCAGCNAQVVSFDCGETKTVAFKR